MKSAFPILFLILLSACRNENQSSQVQLYPQPVDQASRDQSDTGMMMDSLHLDNGKKWDVDTFATNGIDRMQNIMRDFNNTYSDPGITQYQALGRKLQGNYNLIFEECPMINSPAHTQLHMYLMSIQIHLNTLEQRNLDKSRASTEFLNNYLARFHEYFE